MRSSEKRNVIISSSHSSSHSSSSSFAHWKFPKGLKRESIWLAYYVSLSRPRSLSRLLSHGLPDRSIIEGGPPESITDVFKELFTEKIAATQQACAQARAEMGWPARQR